MTNDDFYAIMPEELVAAMDARGARKAVIVRDLARYYDLLERGMKSLDGLFSESELHFLADIFAGTKLDGMSAETLLWNVEDTLRDYGQKWEINAAAIHDKVRSLNQVARCALIDSIETFWAKAVRDEDTTPLDIVRSPEKAEAFFKHTRYDEYYSQ